MHLGAQDPVAFGPEIIDRLRDPLQREAAVEQVARVGFAEFDDGSTFGRALFLAVSNGRLTKCPDGDGGLLYLLSFEIDPHKQDAIIDTLKDLKPERHDYPLLAGVEFPALPRPVHPSDGERDGLWSGGPDRTKRRLCLLKADGVLVSNDELVQVDGWIGDFNADGMSSCRYP